MLAPAASPIYLQERKMKSEIRSSALNILDGHRIMTVATNRPDGWPQATIVGYANDGLVLYFFVSRLSQKFANIKRDPRVSVTIGDDFKDPNKIKGLSLAGRAEIVTADGEFERVFPIFLARFPEYAKWPRPTAAVSPLIKITPSLLSILDYSKGFGHSDLVAVEGGSLHDKSEPSRSDWLGRQS
jgi:general stress protein 26